MSQAVVDLRAGGRFFTLMNGPDGEAVPNEGSFLEVVAPQGDVPGKLVFTDMFAADFAPVDGLTSGAGLRFAAILTFAAEGAGTRYRAVVRHATTTDAERHGAMGFHAGWGIAADQLETLARTL